MNTIIWGSMSNDSTSLKLCGGCDHWFDVQTGDRMRLFPVKSTHMPSRTPCNHCNKDRWAHFHSENLRKLEEQGFGEQEDVKP